MWNKEMARRKGRPLTSRNHTRPIPHVVPRPGESPRVMWPLEDPRFVGARKPPGLQTRNRTRVITVAQLLRSLSLCMCPETFTCLRPQRVWAEAGETGASLPYLPPPPAPPADSPGASASYQGPPARHQHTSPLAAPSAWSTPLSLAPNWLQEVGRKGGAGVPQGPGGTARGLPT